MTNYRLEKKVRSIIQKNTKTIADTDTVIISDHWGMENDLTTFIQEMVAGMAQRLNVPYYRIMKYTENYLDEKLKNV